MTQDEIIASNLSEVEKANERIKMLEDKLASIKQAIAELESQEPFGIWHQGATDEESDFYLYSESGDVSCPNCIKLYTTPPQRTEQEPVVDAFMVRLYNVGYKSGHHDTVEGIYIDLFGQDMDTYHSDFVSEWLKETCNTTPPAQPAPVPLTDDVLQKIISNLEPLLDAKNQSWAEAEKMLNDIAATPPQRTEQNFCSRCGKRTADLTTIHTCTPPQD